MKSDFITPLVFDAQSECKCMRIGCTCTNRIRHWFGDGEHTDTADKQSHTQYSSDNMCCAGKPAHSSEEHSNEDTHSPICLSRRFVAIKCFRLDLQIRLSRFNEELFLNDMHRALSGLLLLRDSSTTGDQPLSPSESTHVGFHVMITDDGETSLARVLNHIHSVRHEYEISVRQVTVQRAIQLQMRPGSIKCGNCVATVRRALEENLVIGGDGNSMIELHADLQTNIVTVFIDPTRQIRDPIALLDSIGKSAQIIFDIIPESETPYGNSRKDTDTQKLIVFDVEGMKCNSCVGKIAEALNSIHGVSSVSTSLKNKRVSVSTQSSNSDNISDIVSQTMNSLGFQVALNNTHQTRIFDILVEGMSCQNCCQRVKDLFADNDTVLAVDIDLEGKRVSIAVQPSSSHTLDSIIAAINNSTKYQASPYLESSTTQNSVQDQISIPRISDADNDYTEIRISNESHRLIQQNFEVENIDSSSRLDMQILGMTCASCVSKVERTIQGIPGVKKGVVNLMAQRGMILYDNSFADKEDIINRVSKLGYKVKEIETTEAQEGKAFLQVEGLQTVKDISDLESLLKETPGVLNVEVELSKKKVEIEFDHDVTNARHLIEWINSSARERFRAELYDNQSGDMRKAIMRDKDINFYKWMFIFAAINTVPSMVLMVLSFIPALEQYIMFPVLPGLPIMSLANFLLSTPVLFIAGYKFFILAAKAVRNMSLDMNCLIALATAEAYLFSVGSTIYGMFDTEYHTVEFFETVSSLIMFMLLGRLLENIAKRKTSQALVALMDLKPKTALLLDFHPSQRDSKERFISQCKKGEMISPGVDEKIISADLLGKNDIVKVLPGDKIPCDGEVIYGHSSVDESMITGESVPVLKQVNDEVIGGTINTDGMLLVVAMRVGSDTTLSSIAKMVENAQTSKPKIAEIADKISNVFVPIIIGISILTLAVWLVLGYLNVYPEEWRYGMDTFVFALRFSVTVVIIACPCALGLATPAALMVGTGVAAKYGVLIKGGSALEQAHGAKAILFDKTGTLTTGVMGVNELVFLDEDIKNDEQRVRALLLAIAAAESSSEHPIAQSICAHVRDQFQLPDDYFFEPPSDFSSIVGRGVKCTIAFPGISTPVHLVVGNNKLMEDEMIARPAMSPLERELLNSPQTLIYVGLDGRLVCIFGISDQLKPESIDVVRYLQKRLRIDVYMLTGDRQEVAEHVASQLGIPIPGNVFADCSPADKQLKVKELQQRRKRVIMVGDGINDSPSLAQANVGMAIGSGTQVASEAADIILVNNSVTSVVNAIVISRVVYRRIIFNFIWAFAYNLLLVPVGAGLFYGLIKPVLIPPWAAGAAMILSSLSVLASSLLLRLYRRPSICNVRDH